MQIERRVMESPEAARVGQAIAGIKGPCIGCTSCRGLCQALIDMASLPEAVLNRDRPA